MGSHSTNCACARVSTVISRITHRRDFMKAFEKGVGVYLASITDPDALSAIKLTLLVAVLTVPLNALFGIAAAWAITKFDFKGKSLLITTIDLPFAISPVIAGLVFVLLFSAHGLFGEFLFEHDIKILFAVPGHCACHIICHIPVCRT